jgi:hypothetical protein
MGHACLNAIQIAEIARLEFAFHASANIFSISQIPLAHSTVVLVSMATVFNALAYSLALSARLAIPQHIKGQCAKR